MQSSRPLIRSTSFTLAVILAITSLSFSGRPTGNKPTAQKLSTVRAPQYVPGEVIIKFKPSTQLQLGKTAFGAIATGITSVDRLIEKFRGEELKPIFPGHQRPAARDAVDLTRFYRLRYRDGSEPNMVARALQSDNAIEYAEPRFIRYVDFTPNDPEYGRQWYIRKVQADRAWDVTKGDTSVVIGIVDTGVDWNHPDLRQNIWHNPHPGRNPNFPADSIGWDFGGLDGTPDSNPDEDRPDHGTGIAGIASAVTNNGIGVAGVGFKCKLMAVKTAQDNIRDNGNALIAYGYEGMVYAADNGASVINASWGGSGYSQHEQDIINYATTKGSLVIAAAGNAGSSDPIYPAGYSHVLAVAATDSTDRRSVWGFFQSSNYGPYVGVSSPGTEIYSTWKPSTYSPPDERSGTSFSVAIVSGAAALVKALHPSWTPDQIAEQIRVTADPIDNLNPGFSKQLGLGRLNVFRAVSDTSSPGLQMISFTLSDSIGGNNDKSIDPGETIRIVGQFRNFLHPTVNATARLTTSDPFITILSGTINLGVMGTLQTSTNALNPFMIQVDPLVPEDYKFVLYAEFTDGTYHDYTGITLVAKATYKDHDINNITLTVTSKGALAFNDYPDNLQGTGFLFHPSGEDNLLYEGAFMAGTDAAHVVDVARSENQSVQSSDFLTENRFSFFQPSIVSGQDGQGAFDDSNAGANKIGLRIRLNTYAFKDNPDRDYIILKYTVVNRKTIALIDLRAGLYFDWDVPASFPNQNIARYDATRRLGYVFDSNTGGSTAFVGVILLTSGPPQFRAIDNDNQTPGNPWGVYDGFTKSEKWESLSGGTTHTQEGPGDVSIVIGTGPLSIAANDSAVIGFAIVAGTSLSGLQANADAARLKWGLIVTDVPKVSYQIPSSFFLYQNYPNPFNPTSKIVFDLPRESHVTLAIYNLLGQEVARLVDERQAAGRYEVPFAAKGLSSGVYFYRMQAGPYTQIRKMVILR